MNSFNEFYSLLNPGQTDELMFRGASLPMDSPAIFGGQLMAQALSVAAATLDHPRPAHYLQTNFLAFGDPKAALEFEVQKIRDGRSTSHRQVILRQGERILLTAALSFQDSLEGYEHQLSRPNFPEPEALLEQPDNELDFSSENEGQFPFIILECPSDSQSTEPVSAVWAKPREKAPDAQLTHQQLFAFFSDATILQSALEPHNLNWDEPGLTVATMNHTIWFQRALNLDDWVLFHSESPSAKSGRALSIANAFSRGGDLVATVAQEGILRVGAK
jgi:acyl-CoA thioesterase II